MTPTTRTLTTSAIRNTTALLLMGAIVLTFQPGHSQAQEAAPAKQKSSQPESSTEADAAAALYTPPTANDAATISAWVEKVAQTPAPDKSPAGMRSHFGKLEQAADSVIARDVETEGLIDAIRLKVGLNSLLEQLGDTSAADRKKAFIAKLKQDKRPGVAVHGRLLEVEMAVSQLPENDNAAAQKLMDDTVALLKEKPLTDAHVSVAYSVAEAIEMNAEEKLATSAYQVFAKYLKGSEDPNHVAVAGMFEGAARRINLVGNSMKLEGKTLDGKPFNVDAWKGKVVLVDFWATWCGPCIEELPNIKALYDKHHKAGFEVVGVNLDDNLGRVSAFVATQDIKWPHLVSEQGQDSPIANYYGVYTLPTTFLIGRDGKVTAVDLFGNELEEEIDRLVAAEK